MSDVETLADVDALTIAVLQRRYAELVTALLDGKVLTRGQLMSHAAMIGPKYQTPAIAAVMQKRK